MKDALFTRPYPHPSYVILDSSGVVRHKFVGPCCGYASYAGCSQATAMGLDAILEERVADVRSGTEPPSTAQTTAPTTGNATATSAAPTKAPTTSPSPLTSSPASGCVPLFEFDTIAADFEAPMDVDLHPEPGLHLGGRQEDRTFSSNGVEAWVANSGNHSLSIVSGIGTEEMTTLPRRDRGYYHYQAKVYGVAFNKQSNTGRSHDGYVTLLQSTSSPFLTSFYSLAARSYGYFATFQVNNNDYLRMKSPNYFMGPSLYDSNPAGGPGCNLVNLSGEQCGLSEACYFLHTDMLHEAPSCAGIAHDP